MLLLTGTILKVPSALRLHKLATIHSSSLARHLGVLESAQQGVVAEKLKNLLGALTPGGTRRSSAICSNQRAIWFQLALESSSTNRFGDAWRLLRHQSSILRV